MDLGLFLPRQIMNRDVQNYGQIFLKILKSKKKKELHTTVMTIDEATCTLLMVYATCTPFVLDFKIFKFQTNDVQVAQTTKGGTGSLVNGHNCTMQLFFFFTFQYFQKKLAIVLDVPIHNLSRQKKSKIHGLGVVFIEENLFYWTFWNKTLHVVQTFL